MAAQWERTHNDVCMCMHTHMRVCTRTHAHTCTHTCWVILPCWAAPLLQPQAAGHCSPRLLTTPFSLPCPSPPPRPHGLFNAPGTCFLLLATSLALHLVQNSNRAWPVLHHFSSLSVDSPAGITTLGAHSVPWTGSFCHQPHFRDAIPHLIRWDARQGPELAGSFPAPRS